MQRTISVALVLAAIACARVASGDGGVPLPWNPFEKVEPGTWWVEKVVLHADKRETKTLLVCEIASRNQVSVSRYGSAARTAAYSAERPVDVTSYVTQVGLLDVLDSGRLAEGLRWQPIESLVTTKKESKKIGGKVLACERVAIEERSSSGKLESTVKATLWLSKSLSFALGAAHLERRMGSDGVTADFELAGYGSKPIGSHGFKDAKVEWGESPDALERAMAPRVPRNPFKGKNKDEWTAFVAKTSPTKVLKLLLQALDAKQASVLAVQDDVTRDVTVDLEKPPTITDLAAIFDQKIVQATEPVVSDEKVVVSGRTFPCKRLAFEARDADHPEAEGSERKGALWLCAEIEGSGIAALELSRSGTVTRFEVAGFGAGEKTSWGKSAEDLKKR